jgi:hypothetical protein
MLDFAGAGVGTGKGNVKERAGVVLHFLVALPFLNFFFHASQATCPSPDLCLQYILQGLFSNKCPSSHEYHFASLRLIMQRSLELETFLSRQRENLPFIS